MKIIKFKKASILLLAFSASMLVAGIASASSVNYSYGTSSSTRAPTTVNVYNNYEPRAVYQPRPAYQPRTSNSQSSYSYQPRPAYQPRTSNSQPSYIYQPRPAYQPRTSHSQPSYSYQPRPAYQPRTSNSQPSYIYQPRSSHVIVTHNVDRPKTKDVLKAGVIIGVHCILGGC